jgi:hypothetical protein
MDTPATTQLAPIIRDYIRARLGELEADRPRGGDVRLDELRILAQAFGLEIESAWELQD